MFILLNLPIKLKKTPPTRISCKQTPHPGLSIEANCAAVAVRLHNTYLPTVGTASSTIGTVAVLLILQNSTVLYTTDWYLAPAHLLVP